MISAEVISLARPLKCRMICAVPKITQFAPLGGADGRVTIGYDEYEVIRLVDYLRMTQAECARKMNISRPTVTRMYEHARHAIADAMVNGKRLEIEGGDVVVCAGLKPECIDVPNCCHRQDISRAGD